LSNAEEENVEKLLARDHFETNHSDLKRKSSHAGRYKDIEDALFGWFRSMELKRASLTDDVLFRRYFSKCLVEKTIETFESSKQCQSEYCWKCIVETLPPSPR
jgi:hypothetical protein